MDEKNIIKKLKGLLGPSRFKHSLRVRDKVLHLSKFHKVSVKKAGIAGLLHDVSRHMDRGGLLKFAEKIKVKIDPISRAEPKLLHASLSAYIARTEFGIRDRQILRAISSHTLGRKHMTMLEKMIYVADHIEEGRSHAGVASTRKLAETDIDQAIVAISSSMIKYLSDNDLPIHPMTIEVKDHYLKKHE
ncbi:MAG: bis(5'-nucleosyl)-tetraphosphatase (symmetrical) YqeK [bacterium]